MATTTPLPKSYATTTDGAPALAAGVQGAEPPPGSTLDDAALLRYSRHILLPEIDLTGQERIRQARVLVVGMGGLGTPAALYLVRSGVGRLTIADGDAIEASNLQRQILYCEADLGEPKAAVAARVLRAANPDVEVVACHERLTGEALTAQVADADVVLDCSDNFATRHAINCACVALGKPLVSGAAVRFDAQLAVYDPREPRSPCYHCLFPEGEGVVEERCAVTGVFSPLVGVIGALQAAETLKLIVGCGEPSWGRLLLFDALALEWRSVQVPRDPACPVCRARPAL